MTEVPNNRNTNLESPCIRNCCLDEQDICLGCYRSIQEITGWSQASDINKQEILTRCAQRKEKAKQRWRSY
jgi:uncharacterized protein